MADANYRLNLGHDTPASYNLLRNTNYRVFARITGLGAVGLHAEIVPVDMYDIPVYWKPVDGMVIVGDLTEDLDKNNNVWNDYSRYSGILKVISGGIYTPALFKYGNVVAISAEGSTFDPSADILWKPQTLTTAINGWSDIQGLSTPPANTVENLSRGIGDPCRLVGLTQAQISSGFVDNNTWRMATAEEYDYLIKASQAGAYNTRGFSSFGNYHVLTGSAVRDASGTLTGSSASGGYWSMSDIPQAFYFSQADPSSRFVGNLTPESGDRAFQIRYIRTTGTPVSNLVVRNPPTPIHYNGGTNQCEVKGTAVPYWEMNLISGDASQISIDVTTGSFKAETPRATAPPLPDIYIGRSWEYTVTGYGLDGNIYNEKLKILQDPLYHVMRPTYNPGRIPKAEGTYTSKASLSPTVDHQNFPSVKWRLVITIPAENITLYSDWTTLDGEVEFTIPENTTGDVRSVRIQCEVSGTSYINGSNNTAIQERL